MIELNWETTHLSPTQVKIANYLQKHTQKALVSTEAEIAKSVNVSIASVSRFWRTVGYTNIKDFKHQVHQAVEVSPAGKMKDLIQQVEKQSSLQYHTLETAVHQLHETMEYVSNQAFQKAAQFITQAQKIYIYCPGPSVGLADLLTYRLRRFGYEISVIEQGGSESLETIMHFNKQDVIILFSFSRLLPEARVILDYAKEVRYRTIIITDQLITDFANRADAVLFASRGEEYAFHSMIAPTFLIENLILSVGLRHKEANLKRLEKLSKLRESYHGELPR
ncbi:putative HTH-type transcriptional regulator YbbH [Paraliobacillus ryukyuensis]|uniref:RpiR family transcriptional regulator n=1 Tax=Paraliobacillus ryukyuensis TaxID=200904 RepID=A0A366EG94_9BACI|nr:MurR/RpiR family transcriptional regulator [Paraliobacillus ryukyuensis]RBP00760.1 RpiR family transcriptional regulator [Paraliobacillus ryukyuensis]